MKKKLMISAVIFVLCMIPLTVSASASAADSKGNEQAQNLQGANNGGIAININGKFLETDQPPVIENGRTLVPLRAIGEALGCEVSWENESKTAIFTQGDVKAEITVGKSSILVGDGVYDEELPIDTPASIINSRTMIPLRVLSECFGYSVDWNAQTKTVTINSKLMSDNDTGEAEEQDKLDTSAAGMASNVMSYANVLMGTTRIIDAVEYKNEDYESLKRELEDIAQTAESKSYDELVSIFSRLKEIDAALSSAAEDAGVSDIVAEYYEPLVEPLNEILNN